MDPKPQRNSSDDAGRKRSSKDDARLKSFLRKAVAVIAAERGLNAQSRLKLESLAKYQKLPDDLFREAIRQLQENDERLKKLNRYENAFVRFLDKEMKKLSGNVLSLAVEQRAIDLAKRKYQIPGEKAELLIQRQTALLGIERISRSEARSYGEKLIDETVGKQLELSGELREELQKKCKKLGLDRKRVEEEIEARLAVNRGVRKAKGRRIWVAIFSTMTAILIVAAAITFEYLRSREIQPNAESDVTPVAQPESEGEVPEWISEETAEMVAAVSAQGLETLPRLVLSSNSDSRLLGYEELIQQIIFNTNPANSSEDLLYRFLLEEPESTNVQGILDEIVEYLRLPTDNEMASGSILHFRRQYRANQLLGAMYSQFQYVDESQRKQDLLKAIQDITIVNPNEFLLSVYVQRSEHELAIGQWNHLMQKCVGKPELAATLVDPLSDLTESRLKLASISDLRTRLVQSILQQDSDQWQRMRETIAETITEADDSELVSWAKLIMDAKDDAFTKFAGPDVVRKSGIGIRPTTLTNIQSGLTEFAKSYKARKLKPLISRDSKVEAMVNRLVEAKELDSDVAPNRIAQIVRAAVMNLEIAQCIHRGAYLEDESFSELDEWMGMAELRLRDEISLQEEKEDSARVAIATASDRNRKKIALETINDLEGNSATKRINALKDLEKVAPRFRDVAYEDAAILAGYFFRDLGDAEWVNIQRTIFSFSRWPNLGLAIADKIGERQTSLDRSLTIARLFSGSEIELTDEVEDWAIYLQRFLMGRVSVNVSRNVKSDTENAHTDWRRLQLFLVEEYSRLAARWPGRMDTQSRSRMRMQPSSVLIAILNDSLDNPNVSTSLKRRMRAGVSLLGSGRFHELEKTILANQLLIEALELETASNGSTNSSTESFSDQLADKLERKTILGDQLYLASVEMLRSTQSYRKSVVRSVLEAPESTY